METRESIIIDAISDLQEGDRYIFVRVDKSGDSVIIETKGDNSSCLKALLFRQLDELAHNYMGGLEESVDVVEREFFDWISEWMKRDE